jgi:hypothetical protein
MCNGTPPDNILNAKIPAKRKEIRHRDINNIFKSSIIVDDLVAVFQLFFKRRRATKGINRIIITNREGYIELIIKFELC